MLRHRRKPRRAEARARPMRVPICHETPSCRGVLRPGRTVSDVFSRAGLTSIAGALLCLALFRCDRSQPRYDYFTVKVDSLAAPDSFPHTESVRVQLFGTIGINGAYTLDRIDAVRSERELDLTVWGRFDRRAKEVTQSFTKLDQSYSTYPGTQGLFRIRVHQPDGSILSDSTTVF